jgi:hypothetical protein
MEMFKEVFSDVLKRQGVIAVLGLFFIWQQNIKLNALESEFKEYLKTDVRNSSMVIQKNNDLIEQMLNK